MLTENSYLSKGDNWLTYKSVLMGGEMKLKFQNVMIEFFVIYTSMDKLILFEKVDLIGLSDVMNIWLLTAIDYKTDCDATVLEVEKEDKGNSFWRDAYRTLKHDNEIIDRMNFFNVYPLKLIKMSNLKWKKKFTESVRDGENYLRTKCLFIDQVYHEGHKNLYESLYANFSLMHQVFWVFRCKEFGINMKVLDKLVDTRIGNKKSSQFLAFIKYNVGKNMAQKHQ
jgi:hypothetical protein